MAKIDCGFKAVNSTHCISDDGTYCIVCKRKVNEDGENN